MQFAIFVDTIKTFAIYVLYGNCWLKKKEMITRIK